jgi:hypothetical protein
MEAANTICDSCMYADCLLHIFYCEILVSCKTRLGWQVSEQQRCWDETVRPEDGNKGGLT